MGMFFSNIHIRKTDAVNAKAVKAAMTDFMTNAGYLPADTSDGGVRLVICASACGWVSVCSDALDFSGAEDTAAAITPISRALHTDVLAIGCVDSDYLFLNLINADDGADAWANVGKNPDGPMPRRTNVSAWKNKVTDFDLFKRELHEKFVFAEEFLDKAAPSLGIPFPQACLCGEIPDGPAFTVEECCFIPPAAMSGPEPPRLVIDRFPLSPCVSEKPYFLSAVNRGGASRGLAVVFSGDFIEKDEITFRDVRLEYGQGANRTVIPLNPVKRQLSDGQTVLVCEQRDFRLPPKAAEGLSPRRVDEIEFQRSIGVRFTPVGNPRRMLDVTVSLVPTNGDAQGLCTWRVWAHYPSRAAYIQKYNRSWEHTFRAQSPMGQPTRLNPDDFDL